MANRELDKSIVLNSALNYTLSLLVKWGLVSAKDAIELEVTMLAKSVIKNNNISPVFTMANISLEALRRRYLIHQKMRLISKKRSYVVLCDKNQKYNANDSASKLVMSCSQCGNYSADLKIYWTKIDGYFLEVPSYKVSCRGCGFIQDIDYFEEMVHNISS